MKPPERILVRGVNWLGDAVMTTPALLRLREAFPAARIALLTPSKIADLWPGHPAVDEVVRFLPKDNLWTVARRARALRCDTALVLPNSPRSAIECWLAGIPRRVGYARPWRNWFLTATAAPRAEATRMRKPTVEEIRARCAGAMTPARPSTAAHQVFEYLRLAAALGANEAPLAPRLIVTPAEIAAAREKFGLKATERWIAVNPGAEYGPAKRWPAARFAEVARELGTRAGARVVIPGGPGDRSLAEEVARNAPGALNLAGRTSLRELMAVLRACDLLLTNDTGPMHVAAALGVPVVAIFGSTSWELTGPGAPGSAAPPGVICVNAPCAPCYLRECPIDFRCMLEVSVGRVLEEVRRVLGAWAARTAR